MTPRTWSMPAIEPPEGQAGDTPNASGSPRPPERGSRYFAVKFLGSAVIFGLIGAVFWSWFPIGLGAFLFFEDGEFIEWALGKIGVRLVPDALGSVFVRAFVFCTGWFALLAYYKESAPTWLLPWFPPVFSWSVVGASALLMAVLTIVAATVKRWLRPSDGIETPNTAVWTRPERATGLEMLGMGVTIWGILIVVFATLVVVDWLHR